MPVRKLGHLWEEFQEFRKTYDGIVVQMDCVEGKKNEPYALLTLHFPGQKLQLALWMPNQTSQEVVEALDDIERHLGAGLFSEMFPVILTDNGHEFNDIAGMERSALEPGRRRTKVFFCEPNRSDEKGACENNHKILRQVIPKGMSLSGIRQSQVSLMMNHVNSQRRKSLFGKAPMDVAKAIFPEDFFILLGLERIPDDKVCLKPSLIR